MFVYKKYLLYFINKLVIYLLLLIVLVRCKREDLQVLTSLFVTNNKGLFHFKLVRYFLQKTTATTFWEWCLIFVKNLRNALKILTLRQKKLSCFKIFQLWHWQGTSWISAGNLIELTANNHNSLKMADLQEYYKDSNLLSFYSSLRERKHPPISVNRTFQKRNIRLREVEIQVCFIRRISKIMYQLQNCKPNGMKSYTVNWCDLLAKTI